MLSVDDAISTILPLAGFTLGIVVYSIFIFRLYKFTGKRDIFKLHLRQYNTRAGKLKSFFDRLLYALEYLFILPVLVFFWFAIFAVLILLLSDQSADLVILVSVAIIAAIRICSYYSEELANDVAKMIPLALLGVFLLDVSAFDWTEILEVWPTIVELASTLLYYLVFIVVLEWILRLGTGVVSAFEKPQF